MSIYIISDIHGCYDDFLSMLAKIRFSGTDQLIMAGDYMDRGKQSYEMLKWIDQCPPNVLLLRGNHEEEFATYVDLMLLLDRTEKLETDFSSNADTIALYESVRYFIRRRTISAPYFDIYGTIRTLLEQNHITLHDLCIWSEIIRKMPYYHKFILGDRTYVIVHAGYSEKTEEININFDSPEQFYLYAREESFQLGGIPHGTIIAGHTPTIAKKSFAYNDGDIFKYYDEEKDCIFSTIKV